MIALYLSPLYLIGNIYICFRTLQWLSVCFETAKKPAFRLIFIALYVFIAASIALAFIMPHSKVQRIIAHISTFWFGIILYIILTLAVAELIRLILKITKIVPAEVLASRKAFVISGLLCVIVIAAVSIWGIYNATHVQDTFYEVTIDKDGGNLDELDIALVADLHLGYTIGTDMMQQMVDKINAQNPDIVLIAGDIFDNDYDAMESPEELIHILSGIQSKYGVYAVYGNHDAAEKILAGFTFPSDEKKMSDIRMDEFLEKANIQLITEETLLIDDSFYLVGRADEERPGRDVEERLTPEAIMSNLDASKPVIVMEHEPKFLQEVADAGIDLHLCGHTHDGQTFPANLTTKLIWENSAGYLKKDDMQSIVTSGVGLFGPNMRVGTKSEVVHIKVHFSGN
ncbi:MAG: metallophosphoesterase [Clostridia bacterium]|nr:metallophosphoesterase [Lachnospiraceae bacterium]NCB99399.1 metallophosphoesterase [Clostridia bacterium]NCD01498.1 metallophosphoesterase [Clostridia bacterium]